MIFNKISIASTPLLFSVFCTALRIDYPRNEVSIRHQQNFNQMRPSSKPPNQFKQEVEVVQKFKSGAGNRFPGMEVDNGLVGNRPTLQGKYPHRFGGTNNGVTFPTYSPKTPSFPTNFGDTNSFTPNFGNNLPKTPGLSSSFGDNSQKTSGFSTHFGENSPETSSFPTNFGDTKGFSPSFPSSSDKDCDKEHHPPMLHSKLVKGFGSRFPFSANFDFGRQNRQLSSEGNFKNNQQNYRDIFGKAFEESRKSNPFSSDSPSREGSPMSGDVFTGPSGFQSDFPSDVFGDDFTSQHGGQADNAAKYDGNNLQKYEKNYASGYFQNAHTYYKLF